MTGASSGIGLEIARIYAGKGRDLVLTARRTDRLDALKAELAAAHPSIRIATVTVDLERPEGAETLLAAVAAEGLAIGTLVNNAGFGLRGRFATMPYADQAAMVELNVTTLTRLCRLVLPDMLGRRSGGIVNVASTAAFQAIPFMGVYAATKAYVLSLSEALHEEARPHGVVVTALCPGPTATEFTKRADLEKSKMFEGAMDARAVAEEGIAGHEAGRAIVVTGARNRLGAIGAQLMPRQLVRRLAMKLQG